ncbi:MAG: beta-glucosidase [Clostridiales bacterium]|nr:beta-glucosidase [Candidatus Blautia equi]
MAFKKDFVWGAATASYQVEGAAYEDGKGLNIWDVFCKEPGKIYENHNGDVACDQYHLYKEDVQIMKEIGVKAYRFSINWARVLPKGTGEVNEKGMEYYSNLVDELLANGIEPYITLYHWDLPYDLHVRGGFMNDDFPDWFYEYAKLIAERLGDRCKNFFTFNEPQCAIGLGYQQGVHAPGLKVMTPDFFRAWHNFLKAHGRAVKALREFCPQPVKIGLAACGGTYYPASESPEDIEAARRATFYTTSSEAAECTWNMSFCWDPIVKGQYPEKILADFKHVMPEITAEDMELISQPIDFLAQNIYNAVEIKADENGNPVRVDRYAGFPKTAIQWPVTPECLYWPMRYMAERYGKPLFISENGMSSHDWISLDGKVHDASRVDLVHRYLLNLKRAADEGIDIEGYFMWSLMDNFEWANGYNDRFGIVYVDYATQKRTLKDSAYFYKEVIAANGENL